MAEEGWRRRVAIHVGGILVAGVAAGLGAYGMRPAPQDPPVGTYGVAVGDLTATEAVIWGRGLGTGHLLFTYDADPQMGSPMETGPVLLEPERDLTGKAVVADLQPATRYYYRARFSPGEEILAGSFVTAPAPDAPLPVTFVWGGDSGGQGNFPPFPAFKAMAGLKPDFFLFSGDTVYADNFTNCPSPARSVEAYHCKYRENRADPNLRALLSATSVYAIWDDHEVVNNFAGPSEPLMPVGRQAFIDYWPLRPLDSDPTRLYRSFRWGQNLELFILDNRQYRDPSTMPDGPSKTMLGSAQKAWLKTSLAASDATFKLVASSVPLSIPTGRAGSRDSWANGLDPSERTGYESELRELVDFLSQRDIRNVLFVTADAHIAQVVAYDPDGDGLPDFHEATSGPLGASLGIPRPLDPTFRPTRLYARGGLRNFGVIRVDDDSLEIEIRDEAGALLFDTTIRGR